MKLYTRGFIAFVPAILIAISALGVATVATAQVALPGSPLYGLKTATENVRLAIALTDESRAKTSLSIAETKLEELQQLHANNASLDTLANVEAQFAEHQANALEEILRSGKAAALDAYTQALESNAARNQEILSKIKAGQDNQPNNALGPGSQ